ncbi:MAG: hypothetical protein QOD77_637 [Thermoplasmata archaeon]|jgi:alpha-beta hydrolase superfamily lysophospholipase|nr:hypothetical protein [Thermoplasmata archaeon]
MEPLRIDVAGTQLHGELHRSVGPSKGGLVLAHGFNSSLAEFGPLPATLAKGGYDVLAFDFRGYGRSGGEPGRTSVELALEDLRAAADALAARTAGPFGVVGHSLGGSYAIAAMGRTRLFGAGVVAHPVSRLFDELRPWEQWGYHVVGKWAERRVRKGKPAGTIPYKLSYPQLFVDQDAARKAKADGFLLGRVSLANYRPAMTMSAAEWARDVRAPVLVFASPHDRAVRPAHTREVYDNLGGPKELLQHRGGHSCFRDLDGPLLADAALAWFDRHLEEAR